MNRGIHVYVGIFMIALAACGGDDSSGGGGGPICRDGLRFSLEDRDGIRVGVVGDGELRTPYIPSSSRSFGSAHWAPDGETLALSERNDESAVASTACEPFEFSTAGGSVVSFSPDGDQLLLTRNDEVDGRVVVSHLVVDVDGIELSEPVTLSAFDVAAADGSYAYSVSAAWSPDSNHVAIAVVTDEEEADFLPGHLYLVQADVIQPEAVEIGELSDAQSMAWSPDGRTIVFEDQDPGVLVVDTAAIDQVNRIDEDLLSCTFPTSESGFVWAPSGGAFLYSTGPIDRSAPCALREVRLDSDEATFSTRWIPDSSDAQPPAWFRDSRNVVHVSADGRTLLWADPRESASSPIATAEGDAIIGQFAFSPASNWLAIVRGPDVGSGELLVAATPGAPPDPATAVAVVQNPLAPFAIQWARSGDRLIVLGQHGVHVVLPDQVAEVAAEQAGWSPDSRYLALLQDGDVVMYLAGEDAALADGQVVVAQEAQRVDWAPLPP